MKNTTELSRDRVIFLAVSLFGLTVSGPVQADGMKLEMIFADPVSGNARSNVPTPTITVNSGPAGFTEIGDERLSAELHVTGRPYKKGWDFSIGSLSVNFQIVADLKKPNRKSGHTYRVTWSHSDNPFDPVAYCNDQLDRLPAEKRPRFLETDHEFVVFDVYHAHGSAKWAKDSLGFQDAATYDSLKIPLRVVCLGNDGPKARPGTPQTRGGPKREDAEPMAPLSDVQLSAQALEWTNVKGQQCPAKMRLNASFRARSNVTWYARFFSEAGYSSEVITAPQGKRDRNVVAELPLDWTNVNSAAQTLSSGGAALMNQSTDVTLMLRHPSGAETGKTNAFTFSCRAMQNVQMKAMPVKKSVKQIEQKD